MKDCKFIVKWLDERNIQLKPGFRDTLNGFAAEYKKTTV